jgi:predicted transglutaminase-like cysteine proteinase
MKSLVTVSLVLALNSASCWAAQEGSGSALPATFVAESRNVLAPLQFVKFCMNYPAECEARIGDDLSLSRDEALKTLEEVNARVNQSIEPTLKPTAPLTAHWMIGPAAGDCNDYAVTKRHELLGKGWPSSALRLALVFAPTGGHLVLVARVKDGDYVLDNLSGAVKPWSETSYSWVSIESTVNPKFWVAVGTKNQAATERKSAINAASLD